jgi:hypothetical protein
MSPRNRRKVAERQTPGHEVAAGHGRALEALGMSSRSWVLEELRFVWREAELEASVAYQHWCRMRDRVAYAIYRAAQDQADACQDALSRHCAVEGEALAQ